MRLAATAFAVFSLFISAAEFAVGGPPDDRPLRRIGDEAGPRPAGPDDGGLYYYENGRRVMLYDTGIAVVKVRPERSIDASKMAQMFPEPDSWLSEVGSGMRQRGWVLVNAEASDGGLKSASRSPDLEWALPVVTTDRQGSSHARPLKLVFTPRIVADMADREAGVQLALDLGLEEISSELRGGLALFRLRAGAVTHDRLIDAANALAERGSESGAVRSAKPDFIVEKRRADSINDPRYRNQWHLDHGSAGGAASAQVSAAGAWAITTGRRDVRVAIIDDSVQGDHPDLAPNFILGRYYDGVSAQTTADPRPRHWRQRHGTPCAGVAVAAANDLGGRGCAPGCGLIGIHFWDGSVAQTADAFRFAADPDGQPGTADGAHVISCSWSWNASFEEVRRAIEDVALRGRGGKGIPVVFAAGNESGDVAVHQWFGTLPYVICVGATNWMDGHSQYSNRGSTVSICAPSSDDPPGALRIDTTDNTDDMPRRPGDSISGYVAGDYTGTGLTGFGGTSSATPLVAGVCGLMLSANEDLRAWQVRSILEHTADRIPGSSPTAAYDPTTSHDLRYGYGRVNAAAAVAEAKRVRAIPNEVWPEPAYGVLATSGGNQTSIAWRSRQPGSKAIVVLLPAGGWRPQDGQDYAANGAIGGTGLVLAVNATSPVSTVRRANARYAVFMVASNHRYSWGALDGTAQPLVPSGPVAADAGPTPQGD